MHRGNKQTVIGGSREVSGQSVACAGNGSASSASLSIHPQIQPHTPILTLNDTSTIIIIIAIAIMISVVQITDTRIDYTEQRTHRGTGTDARARAQQQACDRVGLFVCVGWVHRGKGIDKINTTGGPRRLRVRDGTQTTVLVGSWQPTPVRAKRTGR